MYIISFGYGVTIIIIENKSDKDAWRKFLVKIGINESYKHSLLIVLDILCKCDILHRSLDVFE